VFAFFADPADWRGAEPEGVTFEDVTLTQEGLGTHNGWTAKIAGGTLEGFDVFTEFVPDRRITAGSSSSLEGIWTYSFESEGTGPRLTVENSVRSFWRFPPLQRLWTGRRGRLTSRGSAG
jgi:hypothetical protein